MSLDQYLGLFIDESKENLQVLNSNLLKLEKEPENTEILNEIFRVAHTFKGMAKTMGFNFISDLTHNMENLLEPLRSGEKKAGGKIVDLLFSCLDKLENLVDSIVENGQENSKIKVNKLIKDLQAAIASKEAPSSSKSPAESSEMDFNVYEQSILDEAVGKGLKPVEITIIIDNECILPSVRAYMINSTLENIGEVIKYMPSTQEIENGKFLSIGESNYVIKVLFVPTISVEDLKNAILDISEISNVEIKPVSVNTEEDYDLQEEDSEDVQNRASSEDAQDNQAAKSLSKLSNQTIRVSAARLDNLMNLVGELVTNKTRIYELSHTIGDNEMINASVFMDNITSEIQEIVMKLRMVPIDQVFNRFPRLVRDISKSLEKDVNLVIKGKDVEIDRAVVDEIGDPLVHLIRNSLDHGIETPEERIKLGKSTKGTIELFAFNEGDNILIKITDDGRGIDSAKILKKAVAKGFITSEAAKSLSENEIFDFIFKPGLSTVEVATDLSGRGVGMDVVKSKVSSLNGVVNITSKINEGTSITITLPSTMAIIQALLVKIAEETYALPLSYINEVIDIKPQEIKKIRNKEVITVRDKTIPLIRLNQALDVPGFTANQEQITVVIVKSQDRYSGIAVSELIGQQEVVIKAINKKLCSEQYISGATTLGNGEVVLILNINNLIRS